MYISSWISLPSWFNIKYAQLRREQHNKLPLVSFQVFLFIKFSPQIDKWTVYTAFFTALFIL